MLRSALVPGLLAIAGANRARGRPDLALFELGAVFFPPADGGVLPTERLHVAALLSGSLHRRPLEPDRPLDVVDAVDLVRAVVEALRLDAWDLEPGEAPGYHPVRTAHLAVGGHVVGHAGELAAAALARVDVPAPAVAIELDVDALTDAPRREATFRVLSPFPRRRSTSTSSSTSTSPPARSSPPSVRRSVPSSRTCGHSTSSGANSSARGRRASLSRCGSAPTTP